MYKVSLVGYGKWGKILLPNLEKRFDVVHVFGRTLQVQGIFTRNMDRAIEDDIDAVVVATPIGEHFHIVYKALNQGKHVFCEKPLSLRPEWVMELAELAKAKGVQLVTDYTYTFSEQLQKAQKEIGFNQLQSAALILKRNIQSGNGNSYWTLAPHLIAILGMFVDVGQLDFTIKKTSPGTSYIIFFDGVAKGGIVVDMRSENKTYVSLIGANKQFEFTDLADGDNIGCALAHFEDAMDGKVNNEDNLKCAYNVTNVIYKWK